MVARPNPLPLLLLEADAVAGAVERYWREGLRTAVGGRLRAKTPDDIRGLVRQIRHLPLDTRRARGPTAGALSVRARDVLREIRQALAAHAELRGTDALRETLDRIDHAFPVSNGARDAIAAALEQRVNLASEIRRELDGFGLFSAATIDEGKQLVADLRAFPSERRAAREVVRAEKEKRDALLAELEAIIRDVRAAARFVFRNQPEIVRAFTSEHERRARRARRAGPVQGKSNQSSRD